MAARRHVTAGRRLANDVRARVGRAPLRHVKHRPELIPDSAIQESADDLLGLDAVAEVVAHVAMTCETPSNIAVFGAWGSGKTSLANLVRTRLSGDRAAKFVYFDAWKYAETPLRRHFLRKVSDELGDTHAVTSLYSTSRTTRYSLSRHSLGVFASIALVALAAAVALICLAELIAWLGDTSSDFWMSLADALSSNVGAVLISTSLITPVVALVIDEMKAELTQTEPSSAEQFDELFRGLVQRQTKDNRRLIVYIDELDRVPGHQVQAVLETMKTFLGQPNCVYVVAADQVVIESAIARLETVEAPARGNPYYSSGSSYLDKMFSYQLHLPALESPTLTRLARALVAGRGGVWADPVLPVDDVVSLLIPSHVGSPRRVKILLNNYVLLAGTAKGRREGLALDDGEYRQLAKATALRTEFPLFFRDVEAHPGLVRATTESILGNDDVLADYAYDVELVDLAMAYASGLAKVDVTLIPVGGQDGTESRRATDQLREYLRRSSLIRLNESAVVYLTAPGSSVGLEPTVARKLEAHLLDGNVAAAISVLDGVDTGARAKAMTLASTLLQSAVGLEVRNSARVLLGVVERFHNDIDPALANRILVAFDRTPVAQGLEPTDVRPLSLLVARLTGDVREDRERQLVTAFESSDEGASALLGEYPVFSERGRGVLRSLASNMLRDGSRGPLGASVSLPANAASELWSGPVVDALDGVIEADIPTASAQTRELLASATPYLSAESRWRLRQRVLADAQPGSLVPTIDSIRPDEASLGNTDTTAILEAVHRVPGSAVRICQLLPPAGSAVEQEVVAAALATIVGSSDPPTRALLGGSGSHLRATAIASGVTLTQVLDSASAPDLTEDWGDAEAVGARSALHAAIKSVGDWSEALSAEARDLEALSIGVLFGPSPVAEAARRECLRVIRTWTSSSSPSKDSLDTLFSSVETPRAPTADDALSQDWQRYVLFLVARQLPTVSSAELATLRGLLPARTAVANNIVTSCVSIFVAVARPAPQEDPEVVVAAARLVDDDHQWMYSRPYFDGLRGGDVLAVLDLMRLAGAIPGPRLVGVLRVNGDQRAWADRYCGYLRKATTVDERQREWRFLSALGFAVPKARATVLSTAKDVMFTSSRSLQDFLLGFNTAFPDWTPDKATLRAIVRAAEGHGHRKWLRSAQAVLEDLKESKPRPKTSPMATSASGVSG